MGRRTITLPTYMDLRDPGIFLCECDNVTSYLLRFESRWHPGVLLQGAAGVVVRGGVSLEVVHQLGDRLLHLYGHGCHCMLLAATLTVHTDLPAVDKMTEEVRVTEEEEVCLLKFNHRSAEPHSHRVLFL